MKQSFYNAAIYCRLSKDDYGAIASTSIKTQEEMLRKYITTNGWRVADVYIDDGISGTTFERKSFNRMLEDIETGKINMAVTKDLSRLGRDYLKTGYFTEVFFPENDVRYIALNDGIDTLNLDNDIVPFKNVLNEMYAKDCSRKIKSAYKVKFARGDYQGAFAPFGYMKDPSDSCMLIIDPESAEIVKLIFSLAKQGCGAMRIRSELVKRKLPTPSAYLYLKNPKLYTKKYQNADKSILSAWWCGAITRILENELYIGNMIHYKEISVSYKSKKRQNQPKEKWTRNEGTHPAIIDMDTWRLVRERFGHRGVNPRKHPPNVFARIARCADCGKSMYLGTYQRNSDRRYLSCITYRTYGKTICGAHSTNYKDLCNIVLEDISQYAKMALEKPNELLNILEEESGKQKRKECQRIRDEFITATDRLNELEILIQKLFEENVSGTLNNANYDKLFKSYQKEQVDLESRLGTLNDKVKQLDENEGSSMRFTELIARYADLEELDSEIVNELCEKILIHQAEKADGKRTQKIEIFYRFVGKLEA